MIPLVPLRAKTIMCVQNVVHAGNQKRTADTQEYVRILSANTMYVLKQNLSPQRDIIGAHRQAVVGRAQLDKLW